MGYTVHWKFQGRACVRDRMNVIISDALRIISYLELDVQLRVNYTDSLLQVDSPYMETFRLDPSNDSGGSCKTDSNGGMRDTMVKAMLIRAVRLTCSSNHGQEGIVATSDGANIGDWVGANYIVANIFGKDASHPSINKGASQPTDNTASPPIQREEYPNVPTGYYALYDDAKRLQLLKVDKPQKGRWVGYTFLNHYDHNKGEWQPVKDKNIRQKIMARIEQEAYNAKRRYKRYKQTTKTG